VILRDHFFFLHKVKSKNKRCWVTFQCFFFLSSDFIQQKNYLSKSQKSITFLTSFEYKNEIMRFKYQLLIFLSLNRKQKKQQQILHHFFIKLNSSFRDFFAILFLLPDMSVLQLNENIKLNISSCFSKMKHKIS
jgi:hypothetical protein